MKRILILLFCLTPIFCVAQNLPDYGFNKVRITEPDKIIQAEINPVSTNPSAKITLFYYWYSANGIHITQGGYSGKLLNGLYSEYYLNKNLKEQGFFKKGLKNGDWKSWSNDGILIGTKTWNNGLEVSGKHVPIWKRLNIFRKKQIPPDSLNSQKK